MARTKKITMDWSKIGIGSVLAFLIGWFAFGLAGAIVLAVIALILLGIIQAK